MKPNNVQVGQVWRAKEDTRWPTPDTERFKGARRDRQTRICKGETFVIDNVDPIGTFTYLYAGNKEICFWIEELIEKFDPVLRDVAAGQTWRAREDTAWPTPDATRYLTNGGRILKGDTLTINAVDTAAGTIEYLYGGHYRLNMRIDELIQRFEVAEIPPPICVGQTWRAKEDTTWPTPDVVRYSGYRDRPVMTNRSRINQGETLTIDTVDLEAGTFTYLYGGGCRIWKQIDELVERFEVVAVLPLSPEATGAAKTPTQYRFWLSSDIFAAITVPESKAASSPPLKAGDTVRCLVDTYCPHPDPGIDFKNSNLYDRLKKGVEFKIQSSICPDGQVAYHYGKPPYCTAFIDASKLELVEANLMPEASSTPLKVGDVVKCLQDTDDPSPDRFTFTTRGYPDDRMKKGDVFQITNVSTDGSKIEYRFGFGSQAPHLISASLVERIASSLPPEATPMPEASSTPESDGAASSSPLKVGDTVTCLQDTEGPHPDPKIYFGNHRPRDRANKGTILTVANLDKPGMVGYYYAGQSAGTAYLKTSQVAKTPSSPEDIPVPESREAASSPPLKVGDVVRCVVDTDRPHPDPHIYGFYVYPRDRAKKGTLITVVEVKESGEIGYVYGGDCKQTAYLNASQVERVAMTPPESNEAASPPPLKAGDLVRCLQPTDLPHPDPAIYFGRGYPYDRIGKGTEFRVTGMIDDGKRATYLWGRTPQQTGYIDASILEAVVEPSPSPQTIPKTIGDLIPQDGRENVFMTEPNRATPSSPYRPGQWVRSLHEDRNNHSACYWRYYGNPTGFDYMRRGEVFRVAEANGNLIFYKKGRKGSLVPLHADCVEPAFPNFWNYTTVALSGAAATGGIAMHNLIADPTVHHAVTGLVAATSALFVTNLGWMTVKHVARGFASWGDRNRRLKTDDMRAMAEAIAAATAKKS